MSDLFGNHIVGFPHEAAHYSVSLQDHLRMGVMTYMLTHNVAIC